MPAHGLFAQQRTAAGGGGAVAVRPQFGGEQGDAFRQASRDLRRQPVCFRVPRGVFLLNCSHIRSKIRAHAGVTSRQSPVSISGCARQATARVMARREGSRCVIHLREGGKALQELRKSADDHSKL